MPEAMTTQPTSIDAARVLIADVRAQIAVLQDAAEGIRRCLDMQRPLLDRLDVLLQRARRSE